MKKMKKRLFFSLFVILGLGGYLSAETQMCVPEVEYQSYACISKVEMNGVVSETPTGTPGETDFLEDFTDDAQRLFKVEPGKTYELKITFSNFDSGVTNFYYLTALFDWNNNLKFEETERYDVLFSAGKVGGLVTKTFNVEVPADAKEKVHMRVMTFYYEDGFPTDPCNWIESGQLEDYMIEIGSSSGIGEVRSGAEYLTLYPNPTTDVVNFSEPISQYSLYSIDGKLVQEGQVVNNTINVADRAPGVYVLKALTNEGLKISNLIIQ